MLIAIAVPLVASENSHGFGHHPVTDHGAILDWPTYGQNPQHTFSTRTTLTPALVPSLRKAWEFRAGDAVTATPTVVHGSVYVGSWDGYFYALDLRSGSVRWKFELDAQPAVSPQLGVLPRDFSSDGGMVTSSAWYEPRSDSRPALVIFAGGYTLYALEAASGRLVWKHAYTGRPELPPDPAHDGTRIFSSPVVTDGKVIFGVSADGARGKRGYITAARLDNGNPIWTLETDADATGAVPNDGCGNVWSSGTTLPRLGLVVFDTADCHFANPPPLSESIVALRTRDGSIAWTYAPKRHDALCDLDFGATPNAGVDLFGNANFLGVGGKDGTYYSLDARTGHPIWSTNVVFGGFSGGFIATTAYDGRHVIGATALGDFGRFETNGPTVCDPNNPRDTQFQEPTAHAFDARGGAVLWNAAGAASFAPTTVAGGMTFNGLALRNVVQVRDVATGNVLVQLQLDAPNWSGIAVVGDTLVLGTGASQQGSPDGVVAFTPAGRPPLDSVSPPERIGRAGSDATLARAAESRLSAGVAAARARLR
jgi:polyvinyl alcohol dehydrogenase (cytochrome)